METNVYILKGQIYYPSKNKCVCRDMDNVFCVGDKTATICGALRSWNEWLDFVGLNLRRKKKQYACDTFRIQTQNDVILS